MKKPIMIGVIVVCTCLAGVISYYTWARGEGPPAYLAKKMTWVLCRKPGCEASYEINLRDYHKYIKKHHDWRMPEAPALICKKCGEASVYRAIKCGKCGLVFEWGSVPSDYNDRCPDPKCGHSKLEAQQKARRGAAGK